MDKTTDHLSVIISLDVDGLLFEKLEWIATTGFSIVEINSTDKHILNKVVIKCPTLRIGAGNIINTQQLEDCHQVGVDFITSPGLLPEIAQTANIYSIHYIPGVATLSEAMQAISLGCKQVRPLPATLSFCTLLNKHLPRLKLFPADIEWEDMELFLNLPAVTAVSVLNPEIKQLKAFHDMAISE